VDAEDVGFCGEEVVGWGKLGAGRGEPAMMVNVVGLDLV
jgi:hypothetical protein